MYGSGVRIGTKVIIIRKVLLTILRDLRQALTACFVAVAGTMTQGSAECCFVTSTFPAAAADGTEASVSAFLSINIQSRNCLKLKKRAALRS